MVNCMVKSCKSRGTLPGITYHQIPKKNPVPWFEALKRSENEYVSHRNVVCSRHFKSDDFNGGKHMYLKPGAVPSLNLDDVCSSEVDFITSFKEANFIEAGDYTPGSSAVEQIVTDNFEEEDPLYLQPHDVPSLNLKEICSKNVNMETSDNNSLRDNFTTITDSTTLQPLLLKIPTNYACYVIATNTGTLVEQSDTRTISCPKVDLNDSQCKQILSPSSTSDKSEDETEVQKKIIAEYHGYSLTPKKYAKLTTNHTVKSIKSKVKAAQQRYRRLERSVLRLKVIVENLKRKHECHD